MRRAKYLLFLLVLTAAVFGLAAVASAAVFSDVKGTKYQEAVDALSQLGIVTGYPDGTIKPDQTITRAEFCAIVARELGLSADVAPT
ncbi:MAG: S-layer homology domain-containing protein, partial [Firmicutes bacterium]|nr:S-layer homology domain-containing protein [Bacillota bacterium]